MDTIQQRPSDMDTHLNVSQLSSEGGSNGMVGHNSIISKTCMVLFHLFQKISQNCCINYSIPDLPTEFIKICDRMFWGNGELFLMK